MGQGVGGIWRDLDGRHGQGGVVPGIGVRDPYHHLIARGAVQERLLVHLARLREQGREQGGVLIKVKVGNVEGAVVVKV